MTTLSPFALKRIEHFKEWIKILFLPSTKSGITPELKNILILMFQKTQAPFQKHAPPQRKSFFGYNYILYKFLELLGQPQLLKHIISSKTLKLLKSKAYGQDQIFAKICKELNWPFIPSVKPPLLSKL